MCDDGRGNGGVIFSGVKNIVPHIIVVHRPQFLRIERTQFAVADDNFIMCGVVIGVFVCARTGIVIFENTHADNHHHVHDERVHSHFW